MLEYVVGPVIAVLVSMKFTDYKAMKSKGLLEKRFEDQRIHAQAQIDYCNEKTELLEKKIESTDAETLKKMLITITPIAKAVKQLQESVGVQ